MGLKVFRYVREIKKISIVYCLFCNKIFFIELFLYDVEIFLV